MFKESHQRFFSPIRINIIVLMVDTPTSRLPGGLSKTIMLTSIPLPIFYLGMSVFGLGIEWVMWYWPWIHEGKFVMGLLERLCNLWERNIRYLPFLSLSLLFLVVMSGTLAAILWLWRVPAWGAKPPHFGWQNRMIE